MRPGTSILSFILAIPFLFACGVEADTVPKSAGFRPYDDFSTAWVDGSKWNDGNHAFGVSGGQLVMETSASNIPAGRSFTDTLSATAIAPTSLEATVSIPAVGINSDGQARVMMELAYQPDANYRINSLDFYFVRVEIRFIGGIGYTARYYVGGCSNTDCTSYYSLTGAGGVLAGLTAGQVVTLGVSMDPATKTASFYMDDGITVYPATVDLTTAPNFDPANIKAARLRTRVIGGSANGDNSMVQGVYDNILIDGGLWDDFSAGVIDRNLWHVGPQSISTAGGVLDLTIEQDVRSGDNGLSFPDPDGIKGIEADVQVVGHTVTGTDPYYRGRIGGYFYNDGNVPGGKPGSGVSDIYAEIGINGAEISYHVARCTGITCADGYELVSDNGAGSPRIVIGTTTPGTQHNLSISWENPEFVFMVDGVETRFDAVAAGAPVVLPVANRKFKTVGARASVGASFDGSGTLQVQFDNVKIK